MELELDQVEPGDRLGHRVLDLRLAFTSRKEKRRSRAGRGTRRCRRPVAGAQRERPRRLHQLALLLAGQAPARGLLEHLLVAALQEQSRTPTAHASPWPSAITCTSMWRAGLTPLHEHGAVAERLRLARALEARSASSSGGSTPRMPRPPPPAAALTTTGKPIRSAAKALDRLDRPPLHGATGTPASSAMRLARSCRRAAHHGGRSGRGRRSRAGAQLDELGLLGDEAPARPRPRRPRAPRARSSAAVEVAALRAVGGVANRRRRLVGLADEQPGARLGAERDQGGSGPLLVELAHGVDHPHGLAAADDRQRWKGRCTGGPGLALRP